jgi:hypothetical protein
MTRTNRKTKITRKAKTMWLMSHISNGERGITRTAKKWSKRKPMTKTLKKLKPKTRAMTMTMAKTKRRKKTKTVGRQ